MHRLDLEDRVIVREKVNDIEDYLQAADLGLFTSETESFCLSILEAMCFGCPSVATQVGGIPEVIEDDVTGTLVASGDAGLLAQAVEKLIDDPAQRVALGQAAQRHARGIFLPESSCRATRSFTGASGTWFNVTFFVAQTERNASNHAMRMFLLILALVAAGLKLSAAGTNSLVPLKISTADATNYYDQEMTVTGKVAQVTIRPAVTFLNLDKSYPNSPFAIVIIHGKSSYYGDANALKGKQIEISGKIIKYKDKPEIALDTTNQLTVLDITNSVTKVKRKSKKIPAIPAPDNAPPVEPSTNSFPEIM